MPRAQLSAAAVDTMRSRLTSLTRSIHRREGLEAVSFRRLAEEAGISHTLPYRYFASKEALLVAVRVECTQHFERYVREQEERHESVLARLRAMASAYVAFGREHPDEYQLMFAGPQPPPDRYPELIAARERFFEHAVALVQQAIKEQGLRGDARQLAHLFWVSLHGLVTLHAGGQLVHGASLASLAGPLVDRLLGGSTAAGRRQAARRVAHLAKGKPRRTRT